MEGERNVHLRKGLNILSKFEVIFCWNRMTNSLMIPYFELIHIYKSIRIKTNVPNRKDRIKYKNLRYRSIN